MSKHTPGPWTLQSCDGGNAAGNERHKSSIRHGGTSLEIIQRVGGTTYPTLCANARLIAAAPELLAACLATVELTEGHAAELARAAIAKATGG